MKNSDAWNRVKKELINRALVLGEYAPGRFGRIMIDTRDALLSGGVLTDVGQLMWASIKKYNPTVIYGSGYGAINILLSTKIAAEQEGIVLKTLLVRESRKNRNRHRIVEGPRPNYMERAVFIDDLVTTGSTYRKTQHSLSEENIFVNTVAIGVLYDMWTFRGTRRFEAQGMPVERLFTRHDVGDTRIEPKNKPVTGELIWRHLAHNQWRKNFINPRPTISGDLVFFANDQYQVFCHNIHNGDIMWEYQGDKPTREKGIGSLLVVSEQHLYFSSYDGTICKISIDNGKIVWKKYLDLYLHSTPYIDLKRKQIYIATEGGIANQRGDIVCLDLETATTKWIFKTKHVVPCSPNLINNMVICGSNDANLYSLDPETGELLWMIENIGEVKGCVNYIDDIIVVSIQAGKLFGIDYNGRILWERTCGEKTPHQFLEVHRSYGLVYVVNTSGMAAAYDKFGNQIWIRKMRNSCFWNCRLYKDQLLVVTVDGQFNLLDASTGERIRYNRSGIPINCPVDFNDNFIAVHSVSQGFFVFRKLND